MSDAQQRIDQLVKNSDVLLFMKGNASFPNAGFRAAPSRSSRPAVSTPSR
jgi:glutaredoxin-related protein